MKTKEIIAFSTIAFCFAFIGASPSWGQLLAGGVGAENPASVHCYQSGGQSGIEGFPEGQMGICTLSDGSIMDEWGFYHLVDNNDDPFGSGADKKDPAHPKGIAFEKFLSANPSSDSGIQIENKAEKYCLEQGGKLYFSSTAGRRDEGILCETPTGSSKHFAGDGFSYDDCVKKGGKVRVPPIDENGTGTRICVSFGKPWIDGRSPKLDDEIPAGDEPYLNCLKHHGVVYSPLAKNAKVMKFCAFPDGSKIEINTLLGGPKRYPELAKHK